MTEASEIWPKVEATGEPYRSCRMCGAKVTRVELKFGLGSVAPTVGETLTGGTSGATGVVEEIELMSGTYAGGDASGYIMLTSPTGIDDDTGLSYSAGESINGSTGGVGMMTATYAGLRKVYGRMWPESALVQVDGGYYCRYHHDFKYGPIRRDEARIDIQEED